jgi:methylenetetrahydrofolate reductase (NADPH)
VHISEIIKTTESHAALSSSPKSEKASETLFRTISDLVPLKPAYVSVTYGAGGSARDLTHNLIVKIQKETNITVVST